MIDEKLLVAQLKDPISQEIAFKNLINQYKERLYWHIRKIVISHDDADDVASSNHGPGHDACHAEDDGSKFL